MKRYGNQKGFTYLTAVIMVIIMGISLAAFGVSWRIIMKREREEELIFRGSQIRDAIARWYAPRVGEHAATPLRDLKYLLNDPRTPQTVRHLRRLYTDPITNGEWTLIVDPTKGIQGVASSSPDTPLKTDGFPDDLKDFAGKTRYSEWRFVYTPSGQTGGGSTQANGATPASTAPELPQPSPSAQ